MSNYIRIKSQLPWRAVCDWLYNTMGPMWVDESCYKLVHTGVDFCYIDFKNTADATAFKLRFR